MIGDIRLAGGFPGNRGAARGRSVERSRSFDRIGDAVLHGLCLVASLLALAAIAAIVYQVIHGASGSLSRFGSGFPVHSGWEANFNRFGAGTFIFGTVVTSFASLLLAVPIAVSIALYLSMVAPGRLRSVIGPMVEMLAAIPSVALGFWGIIVLGPAVHTQFEPFLHSALGFLPIFGVSQTTGTGVFTAILILTIMVVPIVAAISRDLFLTVPQELKDGATALGATRWEVIRGVVLPSAASGVVAASFLGLGRALGEAIAVTQVIGAGETIHASLFQTGDTLASRIAEKFAGATSNLEVSSLFYLGMILLAIELVVNVGAQLIARRFNRGAVAA
jgi:phosphate transport system permease protein